MDGLIDRRLTAGTINDIVGALGPDDLLDPCHDVFVARVYGVICAEFQTNLVAVLAGSDQHHRTGAQRFCNRNRQKPDWPRSDHHHALAGNQTAKFGEAVHRCPCRDHQRRLGIRHVVGTLDHRIDVVDGIFGEPAIGREAVGAMPLVSLAVVEPVVVARGIHAHATTLALTAACVNFDRDPVADLELVNTRPQGCDRAHVFVARREVLVERRTPLEHGRRAISNDLEISRADCDGIDPHQGFGPPRHGNNLVDKFQLVGVSQYPGLHMLRHWHRIRVFHTVGVAHDDADLPLFSGRVVYELVNQYAQIWTKPDPFVIYLPGRSGQVNKIILLTS